MLSGNGSKSVPGQHHNSYLEGRKDGVKLKKAMIGKDKSHFFDLGWLIFVLRTTLMFPSVFRHDHRMILFVSCLSGLAQYCCSLKWFMFNRGTAQSSSK